MVDLIVTSHNYEVLLKGSLTTLHPISTSCLHSMHFRFGYRVTHDNFDMCGELRRLNN